MNSGEIEKIVQKYKDQRGELISILEEIQAKYGFIPTEAMRIVAHGLNRSLVDVYGVATFYRAFSLKPKGKHHISVCLGTACHVRGAPTIAKEFQAQLGIKSGETTQDRMFSLETVNCLGACALGPIVVVDGHYFSKVTKSQVKKIIKEVKEGLENISIKNDPRVFPVQVSCPRCNHSLMDPQYFIDGYPSIKVTMSFGRKHGWLRLSSLYGSYTVESEYKLPQDTVINFFCPHCHTELVGGSLCSTCGAPMVSMIVKAGGVVQICSRHGCKAHMLDLSGVSF